jgi:hypothetical protein
VTSDDARDVARGQRPRRLAGAWQRQQQVQQREVALALAGAAVGHP